MLEVLSGHPGFSNAISMMIR